MINLNTTNYLNTVPALSPVIEKSAKRQLFVGQGNVIYLTDLIFS